MPLFVLFHHDAERLPSLLLQLFLAVMGHDFADQVVLVLVSEDLCNAVKEVLFTDEFVDVLEDLERILDHLGALLVLDDFKETFKQDC